ncbi:unnamed protein product, partial [Brassica rapa]
MNPESFHFIIFAPSTGEHPSSILEIQSNRGATTHTRSRHPSLFSGSPHTPSKLEPFTRRVSLEPISKLIRSHQATTYRTSREKKQNPMVLLQKPAKQSLGSLHSPGSKAGDDEAMKASPSRSLISDQMKNKVEGIPELRSLSPKTCTEKLNKLNKARPTVAMGAHAVGR